MAGMRLRAPTSLKGIRRTSRRRHGGKARGGRPAYFTLAGDDRRGVHGVSERACPIEPFVQEMPEKLWIVCLKHEIDIGVVVESFPPPEASDQPVLNGQSFTF